jgi:hypothetical protein
MLTRVRLPPSLHPGFPGVYLALGIITGCILGPFLYRLLLHDISFESITAISTVALAVATVYLGVETRRLAAESIRTEYQSERQHQQTMTPLLKLTKEPDVTLTHAGVQIYLGGDIENRGSGPAFDVRIELESPDGKILASVTIEPLGVRESTPISFRIASETRFQSNDDWKLRIRYGNLFGATAMTVYRGLAIRSPSFVRPPIVVSTPDGIRTMPVVEKV